MSAAYDSSKRLLRFKYNHKNLSTYIAHEKNLSIDGEVPEPNPLFTPEELAHEQEHASVWSEKSISTSFGRSSEGYPFTAPDLDDVEAWIKRDEITADQYLNFYLRVVKAPKDAGMSLGKTDLTHYKILTGEIKTIEELALYEFSFV